jgi:S-layer homology domain
MNVRLRLALSIVGWISLSPLLIAQATKPIHSGDGPATAASLVRSPDAFGLTEHSATSVYAGGFTSTDTFDDQVLTNSNGYRYFTRGLYQFLGSISIPSGVIIDYVGINVCDAAGGTFTIFIWDCTPGSPCNEVVAGTTGAGACGMEYNSSPVGYSFAQNAGHNLQISIFEANTAPTDGSVGVQSVELQWKRQVSPAPGAPDFGDVLMSNPQFQYIEALFQAGITAGCGGGNYCPNNPVTRGQMAVYLAKALGLNWPN